MLFFKKKFLTIVIWGLVFLAINPIVLGSDFIFKNIDGNFSKQIDLWDNKYLTTTELMNWQSLGYYQGFFNLSLGETKIEGSGFILGNDTTCGLNFIERKNLTDSSYNYLYNYFVNNQRTKNILTEELELENFSDKNIDEEAIKNDKDIKKLEIIEAILENKELSFQKSNLYKLGKNNCDNKKNNQNCDNNIIKDKFNLFIEKEKFYDIELIPKLLEYFSTKINLRNWEKNKVKKKLTVGFIDTLSEDEYFWKGNVILKNSFWGIFKEDNSNNKKELINDDFQILPLGNDKLGQCAVLVLTQASKIVFSQTLNNPYYSQDNGQSRQAIPVCLFSNKETPTLKDLKFDENCYQINKNQETVIRTYNFKDFLKIDTKKEWISVMIKEKDLNINSDNEEVINKNKKNNSCEKFKEWDKNIKYKLKHKHNEKLLITYNNNLYQLKKNNAKNKNPEEYSNFWEYVKNCKEDEEVLNMKDVCYQQPLWEENKIYKRDIAWKQVMVIYENVLYYLKKNKWWSQGNKPKANSNYWEKYASCGKIIDLCNYGEAWDSNKKYTRMQWGDQIFVTWHGNLYEMTQGEYRSKNKPPHKEKNQKYWNYLQNCENYIKPTCEEYIEWQSDLEYTKKNNNDKVFVFYDNSIYQLKKRRSYNKNPTIYENNWKYIEDCPINIIEPTEDIIGSPFETPAFKTYNWVDLLDYPLTKDRLESLQAIGYYKADFKVSLADGSTVKGNWFILSNNEKCGDNFIEDKIDEIEKKEGNNKYDSRFYKLFTKKESKKDKKLNKNNINANNGWYKKTLKDFQKKIDLSKWENNNLQLWFKDNLNLEKDFFWLGEIQLKKMFWGIFLKELTENDRLYIPNMDVLPIGNESFNQCGVLVLDQAIEITLPKILNNPYFSDNNGLTWNLIPKCEDDFLIENLGYLDICYQNLNETSTTVYSYRFSDLLENSNNNLNFLIEDKLVIIPDGEDIDIGGGSVIASFPQLSTSKDYDITIDNYLWIEDNGGKPTGYQIQIDMANLVNEKGEIFPVENIQIYIPEPERIKRALKGDDNKNFEIPVGKNSIGSEFVPITSSTLVIKNNSIDNLNKTGIYGVKPVLKVTVPSFQKPGRYKGNLIYTIMHN